jgi:hypothetical protein
MDAELRNVISRMIASIRGAEARSFYLGLVGYFVEGIPIPASGLSVDPSGTEHIQETDEGFYCQAYFSPKDLYPAIVQRRGVLTKDFGKGPIPVVPVNIEVRRRDIYAVAECIGATQHALFRHNRALVEGFSAFRRETSLWLAEHGDELS